jgi:hypothetical protein
MSWRAGARLLFGEEKMANESFDQTMEAFMSRSPFKPFIIELKTGVRFELDHPGATIWGPGTVTTVFKSPGGTLIFYDHDSVNRVIDVPAHSAP